MKIHRSPVKKARIEIIPMIDVIFFLLVFFMMSSLSMVRMKGVGMALPRQGGAAQGPNIATTVPAGTAKLVVTVTGRGEYFIGRQHVAKADFKSALTQEAIRRPDAVVILNVAKTQNTQSLIDVIDSVHTVGSPSGQPLQILIATEAVDANGNAVKPAK